MFKQCSSWYRLWFPHLNVVLTSCSTHSGDSLLLFARVSLQKESVALAMRVIDESEVRGYKLHVEAARFELKGQYDASKKKKKSKDYKKKMLQQQK